MKKVLLGLAVLVIAAVVVVYVQLGAIFKRGLETYGPKMLGAPVSVGVVTLSPFSGEGHLRLLKIGNPKGYKSPHAITVNSVSVAVDVSSIFGGKRMVIKDVVVDGPEITLETGPNGTNLQQLQRNLEAYSPSDKKEQTKTSSRPFEIARFRLKGAKAAVSANGGQAKEVQVPDLELTGIGAKSGGATAAQAAKEILGAVVGQVLRTQGKEILLQRGSGLLKDLLNRK